MRTAFAKSRRAVLWLNISLDTRYQMAIDARRKVAGGARQTLRRLGENLDIYHLFRAGSAESSDEL